MKDFIVKNNLKGKTFAEINCGIGGFRLALDSFGMRCVFAADADKHSADVYENNFNERPATSLENIPEHDMLVAKLLYSSSKNANSKGFTLNDIISVVATKNPKIVILESSVSDNEAIIKILEKSDYSVHCSIINTLNYNVPQNRKSVYIVAFRQNMKVYNLNFPEPITLTKHVEDILESESDIPAKMYVNRTDVVMNSKDLNSYSDRPIQIGHIAANRQGERIYSIKGAAITLTANGGGQFSKTGGYLINNKLRKLTPRECARLMGFPDDYIISKSNNQAYNQFGNSVVVDIIQMILESIASALCDDEDNKNKESVEKDSIFKSKDKKTVKCLSKFNIIGILYKLMLCIRKVSIIFDKIATIKSNSEFSVVKPI